MGCNGNPGKSMKNAQWHGKKGTSWAEVMSNSEKIKLIALAIVRLCKSEGISQSGS